MKLRESIYKQYIPGNVCEQVGDGKAYWFVFSLGKMLVKIDNDRTSTPFLKTIEELNIVPIRTQYLGTLVGKPCYSVEVSSEEKEPDGMAFRDLRSLYGSLEEDIFILAGRALQIVAWDQTHQYCGRCGTHTKTIQGERAKQ